MKVFIIFTGPSGAGKTTLVHNACSILKHEHNLDLTFSVSATTRKKRYDESNYSYLFINKETFRKWIEEERFLEWVEKDTNLYGIPLIDIHKGNNIVFDTDTSGVISLSEYARQNSIRMVSIAIQPPSIEELEARLRRRNSYDGNLSEEHIQARLQRARTEMSPEVLSFMDHVVINDDFDRCLNEVTSIILNFLQNDET